MESNQAPVNPHDSSGEIIKEESPIESNDDDLHHKYCSSSLKKKLRELLTDLHSPTIFKVHNKLRSVNNHSYDPNLVAIGPYHHKQEKLKKMEKKKLQFLQQFLNRGRDLSVEVCVSTIQGLKPEAQRWYDEPIDLNPPEFVEMLVVDGCFIIEFILQYRSDSTGMPVWMESGITEDLILFENQIPYCVISELFSLIGRRNLSVYLLDLFRSFSYPIKKSEGNIGSSEDDIKHVLDLIYRNLVPMPPVSGSTKEVQFISSATQLSKFNVKFRKGEPNDSIFQISFENGTFRLPHFKIENKTEDFFRNLIAYEQHFHSETICYVSDFAILFDCLINDGEDVKLLEKNGIIENWLGSDDAIAHMFNKLGDHVFTSREFTYKGEFKKVQEHCKKRRNAWMAKLKQNYFNSPWTVVSVIAAFVLLVLTFLQTLFTIIK